MEDENNFDIDIMEIMLHEKIESLWSEWNN